MSDESIFIKKSTTITDHTIDVGDNEHVDNIVSQLIVNTLTGSAPTIDVVFQHSMDGVNWFDKATHAQLSAAGSNLATATGTFAIKHRYSIVFGGTVTESDFELRIKLHPFS